MSYSSGSKSQHALPGELRRAGRGRRRARRRPRAVRRASREVAVLLEGSKRLASSPAVGVRGGRPAARARVRRRSPAARTKAGDLVLLLDLPVDVVLDVGVVGVEDDHLGGAARRAAGLDRAGRAVADLEEGEEARGDAAAGEGLVEAADLREVGARARAVLEEARLAGDEVHDAALVHEVVLDVEDEAVVHHEVVREVLPALGLDVVDGHQPRELEPDDRLLAQRGKLLAGESLGARHGELRLLASHRRLAQTRAGLKLVDTDPLGGFAAVPRGQHEVVTGRLERRAVFQHDTEDGLDPVFHHRHDPGRAASAVGAVEHFHPDEAALHDRADRHGTVRGGHGRVEGLARVRLRALVGAGGLLDLVGLRVDEVVALRAASSTLSTNAETVSQILPRISVTQIGERFIPVAENSGKPSVNGFLK